jgi:sialidase-1
MKTRLLLYAAVFVLSLAALPQASAAEPMFTDLDLFASGQDNVNIYRIPALLVTSRGTILAFIEAREGDDGDPTDLVLKRSVYVAPQPPRNLNGYPRLFGYGVNWEPMRTVVTGKGEAVLNPCAVLDKRTGRIWLSCNEVHGGLKEHIKDVYKGRNLLTWSDDEGVTWSPPRDLSKAIAPFLSGPGVGVQLRTGRLVIPGYGPGNSCVVYSDDHGTTWQRGAQVKGMSTDESQAVELSDGVLMLVCKSNRRPEAGRYVAHSRDGGQTWFEEHDEPALPEMGCQGCITGEAQPAAEGAKPRLLTIYPKVGNRTILTAKVSTDDGKTWSAGRTIQPGPAAYSSVAFLKDGTIGVLYETGKVHPYEKISFARFNLEWLTGK